MARALIADPELPRKVEEGRTDEVRGCIGCNDACIHQVMQVEATPLHPEPRRRPGAHLQRATPRARCGQAERRGRRRRCGGAQGRGDREATRPRRHAPRACGLARWAGPARRTPAPPPGDRRGDGVPRSRRVAVGGRRVAERRGRRGGAVRARARCHRRRDRLPAGPPTGAPRQRRRPRRRHDRASPGTAGAEPAAGPRSGVRAVGGPGARRGCPAGAARARHRRARSLGGCGHRRVPRRPGLRGGGDHQPPRGGLRAGGDQRGHVPPARARQGHAPHTVGGSPVHRRRRGARGGGADWTRAGDRRDRHRGAGLSARVPRRPLLPVARPPGDPPAVEVMRIGDASAPRLIQTIMLEAQQVGMAL